MSKVIFKSLSGRAPELFPVNIFDKIPDNHPVKLVDMVVDQLDITDIIKSYKGGGTSSYHPRMMIKVLFYGYLCNVYSCRKMAKALNENIHFVYLADNSTPDFRTINNFRGKRLKGKIQKLFAEVVRMLVEMGYISLDVQYIDGTKIESAAGRYTFVWRGSVEKNKAKLESKIKRILKDIEDSIQSDNQEANTEELPKNINSDELKKKLSEINQKLKQPTKQEVKALEKLQQEHLPKLEEYEQKLEILGNRNSYSKTDKDATFMRMKEDYMKNGQLKPAYNTQISTENQFITHASIHQKPGDTTTLQSHLEGYEKSYGKHSKEVIADAGYGSEENYEMMEQRGIEAYVKYNYFHKEQKRKMKNNPFLVQNLFYNKEKDFFVCPMGQKMEKIRDGKRESYNGYISDVSYYQAKNCEGCPLRSMCHQSKENRVVEVNHNLNRHKEKVRALLTSEKGFQHRSKRPVEVEAVFGQLKFNNKFTRFTLRSLEKVEIEFLLMALGHNLRKWAKRAGKPSLHSSFKALISSFYKQLKAQTANFSKIDPSQSEIPIFISVS